MKKAKILLTCFLLFCGSLSAQKAQVKTPASAKAESKAMTEGEVREFLASYAEDLRQSRREALANRYDSRGTFFLGHGKKNLRSLEDIKNSYLTKWMSPKSFEWKDISVEVLSADAAVVFGLFDWQSTSGEVRTYSYTGLLIRHEGKWHIRLEDESAALVKGQ
jgi:hypothetical protein